MNQGGEEIKNVAWRVESECRANISQSRAVEYHPNLSARFQFECDDIYILSQNEPEKESFLIHLCIILHFAVNIN